MTTRAKLRKHTPSAMGKQEAIAGYLFFLPCLLGLVLLTYGQMIFSLIISFTDWNVFKTPNFIGLSNYIELFKSDFYFVKSLKVTVYSLLSLGSTIKVSVLFEPTFEIIASSQTMFSHLSESSVSEICAR